ncbi:hypothetical protein BIY21_14785 [Vibrio ponticus]|uniref:Uncharacterized protein n=1 Tax=Vibrio ponticus TaxID=265668 RepID=A0ABX3FGC3_9VIBR|nr:hypothetical protein [Vibrio ponticus]OLQ89701.1 hypothetical protein BIY21_14785 [Vibrio ponticus]
MNATTLRTLNYLNANKAVTVTVLLLINIASFFVTSNSEVNVYGRIEAEGYRWATYSTLLKQDFETRIIFSKLDEPHAKTISHTNTYVASEVHGNSFISLGNDDSIAISHNQIFAIDDKCALFFSGREKFAMENASLRCFY